MSELKSIQFYYEFDNKFNGFREESGGLAGANDKLVMDFKGIVF